jgi:hypothetical protein
VNIHVARLAENLYEARFVDFTRNDFGRNDQAGKQGGKVAGCSRILPPLVEDMLLNRSYLAHGGHTLHEMWFFVLITCK